MAKTLDPFYSTAVRNVAVKATAAKTTMSDGTNAVLLFTAGAEGSVVNRLKAWCLGSGSIPDTLGYIFTSSDGGTTLHMKCAKKFTAQTVSTTVPAVALDFDASHDEPLEFAASEKVYVAISVALAAGFEFEGSVEDF